MAIPRFAWGIDIGNRALKAIKLVRDGDNLRMEDVEVIEHEQVLSNSGDNRESLIQTALANFAQRHLTKGGVVSVGVSGQSSFARFIKLPPVEEKKIPEIVKFEAIQQIPFPLDQVEWSYQLFRQTDSPDVEVGIFAMRKELVNQQIKYFTDMDMNVQVVQMSPLAVYNAMYYDNRLSDGTTMILDLGAENADLIIADGDSVWLRSVPIGGNNFTEALVKSFKLSFAKAEELKRNLPGDAPDLRRPGRRNSALGRLLFFSPPRQPHQADRRPGQHLSPPDAPEISSAESADRSRAPRCLPRRRPR